MDYPHDDDRFAAVAALHYAICKDVRQTGNNFFIGAGHPACPAGSDVSQEAGGTIDPLSHSVCGGRIIYRDVIDQSFQVILRGT